MIYIVSNLFLMWFRDPKVHCSTPSLRCCRHPDLLLRYIQDVLRMPFSWEVHGGISLQAGFSRVKKRFRQDRKVHPKLRKAIWSISEVSQCPQQGDRGEKWQKMQHEESKIKRKRYMLMKIGEETHLRIHRQIAMSKLKKKKKNTKPAKLIIFTYKTKFIKETRCIKYSL